MILSNVATGLMVSWIGVAGIWIWAGIATIKSRRAELNLARRQKELAEEMQKLYEGYFASQLSGMKEPPVASRKH